VSATRDIVTTTRRIADAIRATPGVAVIGCPDVSVVAFDSPEFNIYAINDGMKERGWALNALQFPSCLHLAVTKCHTLPGVADRFIKDLQEVTAIIRLDPSGAEKSDSAVFYGVAAAVPDRSIVSALQRFFRLLRVCYHWWDRVDNSGLQGLQGQRQRGRN